MAELEPLGRPNPPGLRSGGSQSEPRRLDGVTKVRSLAGVMREAFPDSRDRLEERLSAYLRAMRRLHLIAFQEWDEPR